MRRLLNVALAAARGSNTDQVVAAGYCFGGAMVLEFACSGVALKGLVTFHGGGLATPEGQSYSKTKGKAVVVHGTADTAVPLTQFAQLAAELESVGIPAVSVKEEDMVICVGLLEVLVKPYRILDFPGFLSTLK